MPLAPIVQKQVRTYSASRLASYTKRQEPWNLCFNPFKCGVHIETVYAKCSGTRLTFSQHSFKVSKVTYVTKDELRAELERQAQRC